MAAVDKLGIEFIITYKEYGLDDYLAQAGFESVGNTSAYVVYQNKK
jgi:hypothetical protein